MSGWASHIEPTRGTRRINLYAAAGGKSTASFCRTARKCIVIQKKSSIYSLLTAKDRHNARADQPPLRSDQSMSALSAIRRSAASRTPLACNEMPFRYTQQALCVTGATQNSLKSQRRA
jgi:hypothetical protein